MRAALLVLLALVIAGCAAPAAEPGAPEPGAAAAAPPFVALAIEGCKASCFEPSVATDRAGRLFATAHVEDELAVSEDRGATWTRRALPPPPTGQPTTPEALPVVMGDLLHSAGRNDGLLQVDPLGRLWFSAMVDANALQVARSDDGAASWVVNSLVPPVAGATAGPVDRQWLGFGPAGDAYLTYMQWPTGLWIARSDDGGATWGAFVQLATMQERAHLGGHGLPVVRADGRIAVPSAWPDPSLAHVRAHVSDDGGATFRTVDVVAPGDRPDDWEAPMASFDATGALLVAWAETRDGVARLLVARSPDGGDAWSAPEEAAIGASVARAWLRADASPARLAWMDEDGAVMVAREEQGAWVAATATPQARGSHHATLDVLPDGRSVTAWGDADGVRVWIG